MSAAARSAALSCSIQSLLQPGTSSFTSPTKRSMPRLIASPLKPRPLLLPTAVARPDASAVPFQSPLRLAARQPLEALRSPTANLPNSVRDGREVLPLNARQRTAGVGRQVDWLTSYCKQRKKESPAPKLESKADRPKKKTVLKGKINHR